MNLYGEKIFLRAIEPSDKTLLLSIINNPETEAMLGGWSFPISLKQQENWIESLPYNQGTLRCIIQPLNEKEGIGTIMLTDIDYKNGNAEVHIKLTDASVRKKGYGTDAVNTIVKYAFEELRLHVVYARVSDINKASEGLFCKCGFTFEGKLQDRVYKNGTYITVSSFARVNRS
ncbi:MAG: GNAT family protein [Clostridium sp.]